MNNATRFLLFLFLLFAAPQVHAAFPVPVAAVDSPVKYTDRRLSPDYGPHKVPGTDNRGWPGVVAFCTAMTGLAPLAIIFGIIGMRKGRKNKGLAIAGLLIGIVYAIEIILLFTVWL